MTQSSKASVPGILLVLAAGAALPVLVSGLRSEALAGRASLEGRYGASAQSYAQAARQLPWRSDLWEQAGIAAYSAGDPVQAAVLLRVGERKRGLSADGWQVLGLALWSTGDTTKAVSAWQDGSASYPADVALLDRAAAAYHALGEYDSERATLERRLQMGEDAGARYRLGLVLMLSDPSRAAQELGQAANLDPEVGSAAASLEGGLVAASRVSNAGARLVVIGRSLGLVGEWGLAAGAFDRAAEADPTDAQARAWLGEAKQHLNQDGRPDLDAAMKLGPQESMVHTLRGMYWQRQGNQALSFVEYSRAAELDPGNPALQTLLGEARAAGGDLVAALAAYQRAVELAPNDTTYRRLLALFCADNDVRVLDVGLPAALKAVELAPNDPQALDVLGWTYAQAGYLSKSEQNLQKAIDTAPNFAWPHLHLGLTYLRWGQNNLAFDQWRIAMQLDEGGAVGNLASQLLERYFPGQ